jgi:hypothetical protein
MSVSHVPQIVNAGTIVGVFLIQFTGTVSSGEGVNNDEQGLLLFNPASELGNLGKLPLGFNQYLTTIEAFIVGIFEGIGEVYIRFVGLDDQDFTLRGAISIPGLAGSNGKGQVITETAFPGTTVGNQGDSLSETLCERAASGDFTYYEPSFLRGLGQEVHNGNGLNEQ